VLARHNFVVWMVRAQKFFLRLDIGPLLGTTITMLNAIITVYLSSSLDSCVYEALVSAGRSKQFSAHESLEKIDPTLIRKVI
jgi:hypothetical protein